MRGFVSVSEEWKEIGNRIFCRRKVDDEPWGEWELTTLSKLPFVKVRERAVNHDDVQDAATGEK